MSRAVKATRKIHVLILVLCILSSIFAVVGGVGKQSEDGRVEYVEDESQGETDSLPIFTNSLQTDGSNISTSDIQTTQNAEVDVMIAYTSDARIWASNNDYSIDNTINEAIGNANTAMENSEIDLTVNLATSGHVDYTETGDDFNTDLDRLEDPNDGYMEEVHDFRDYYGADLVSLFVEGDEDNSVTGIANAPSSEYSLQPDYGFSVVSIQDISSGYIFTHEIGHNFGAGHAKDQDSNPGPQLYDYSAGWRWNGDKLYYDYVSVMTYVERIGDERVLHYSNPYVYHEGDPTGDSEDGDNARTISETKGIVSNYQEPTPQIDLLTPTGGEELYAGAEQEIEWETVSGDNGIDGVDLWYSTDGGSTWTTIAQNVPDTGSYTWEVPDEPDTTVLIGAEAIDGAGYSRADTSDYEVEIVVNPPQVDLLSPVGGEEWYEGSEQEIEWETVSGSYLIDDINLDYSTDDGITWTTIAEGVSDSGSYTWQVPDKPDTTVLVRAEVVDEAGYSREDISDYEFEIMDPPQIDILSPTGGEEWTEGSEQEIEWETVSGSYLIDGIDLSYSTDGGSTWTTIDENVYDSGSYTWEVPNKPDTTALLRVEVVDEGGYTQEETLTYGVEIVEDDTVLGGGSDLPWFGILLLVILAVMIAFFLVVAKRRKKKKSERYQSSYPQGPYYGGQYEEKTPSQGEQVQQQSNSCPDCGQSIRYIQKYNSWYCDNCREYKGKEPQQQAQQEQFGQQEEVGALQPNQRQQRQVQKENTQQQQQANLCPDCDQPIRYIEEYDSWYCDSCREYK